MARKTFTTTIEEDLSRDFKSKCKEDGVTMNEMLEMFMRKYLDNKVIVMRTIDFEGENKNE